MGMAASQARYLGLTARKTNVEYEGQQVNQQRTALANQSANLFNQLLTLKVPTPPSTTDYTTLQYSYNDGFNDEVITKYQQLGTTDPDYNYMVTHYHYENVYTGAMAKLADPQVQMDKTDKSETITDKVYTTATTDNPPQTIYHVGGVYDAVDNKWSGGYTVSKYDETNTKQKALYDAFVAKYPTSALASADKSAVRIWTDSENNTRFTTADLLSGADVTSTPTETKNLTDWYRDYSNPTYVGNAELSLYDATDDTQKAAINQIRADLPDSVLANTPDAEIYTYTNAGKRYFTTLDELKASAAGAKDPTKPIEAQAKLTDYYAVDLKTKIEKVEKALLETDESGRFSSVRYEDSSAAYTLNCETITDDNAYKDAMNKYNYDIKAYEQEIQNINAKTEIIQQEDRTLELRLKQLDTEQEALQTEMEAVKKVIDKNIEQTFKTFN